MIIEDETTLAFNLSSAGCEDPTTNIVRLPCVATLDQTASFEHVPPSASLMVAVPLPIAIRAFGDALQWRATTCAGYRPRTFADKCAPGDLALIIVRLGT